MRCVPSVIIEYVDTADMADGQPLPPYIDDGVVWRMVRRLPDSRTRWRRIRLSTQSSLPSRGRVQAPACQMAQTSTMKSISETSPGRCQPPQLFL
jgi:hypothetical protein